MNRNEEKERIMTREEAAAKAQYEAVTGKPWDEAPSRSAKLCREDSAAIAKALDAFDAANQVHRIRTDDVMLERIVDALVMTRMGDYNIELSEFRQAARAVLAAAVKEDGE